MWWIVIGVVAVWTVMAVVVGAWIGTALDTAEIEDGADRVRRDVHSRMLSEPA